MKWVRVAALALALSFVSLPVSALPGGESGAGISTSQKSINVPVKAQVDSGSGIEISVSPKFGPNEGLKVSNIYVPLTLRAEQMVPSADSVWVKVETMRVVNGIPANVISMTPENFGLPERELPNGVLRIIYGGEVPWSGLAGGDICFDPSLACNGTTFVLGIRVTILQASVNGVVTTSDPPVGQTFFRTVDSFVTPLMAGDGTGGGDCRFIDVCAGGPHQADIEWVAEQGISFGCDAAGLLFCPTLPVTRAQMASFLVRSLNLPPSTVDSFTDDSSSIHQADINALAAAGITTGCGGTSYCPDAPVLREQMASFLVRAFGLPATAADYFADDSGSLHEADINSLRESGITTGMTESTYGPKLPVLREQMASFLHRALT